MAKTYEAEVEAGLAAWGANDLYADPRGNYRRKSCKGRIAPFNKALKAAFHNVDELHAAHCARLKEEGSNMKTPRINAILKAAGVSESVSGAIGDTFVRMGIAEEEIGKRDIPGLFLALCPPPELRGLSDDAYRSHCRELIARAKAGKSLAPATDAECLASLLETALTAPLNQNGAATADWLFARVCPRANIGDPLTTERWPGQVAEDVDGMRKRLAKPERDAKPVGHSGVRLGTKRSKRVRAAEGLRAEVDKGLVR